MDQIPEQAKNIYYYYAAATFLALMLIFRGKPKRGMRLRLTGRTAPRPPSPAINNPEGPAPAAKASESVKVPTERPLNVVFNYNGHSWDAYEVFGLPAGSSLAKVEEAYRQAVAEADPTSQSFLQAAYQAVSQQWRLYKQAQ